VNLRFEVQVLDDSTNAQTRAVVDKAIVHWRKEGIVINAVRRTNRQGFKAGAMHEVRSPHRHLCHAAAAAFICS
jgi:hypothetical protein